MATLHDQNVRASLETRLGRLQDNAQPGWGKMSVDQMLWHVNQAMAAAVGEVRLDTKRPPIPRPLLKFLVLNLPWTKNAPTNPSLVATGSHDFSGERDRCRRLIAKVGALASDAPVQDHPAFGLMSVADRSRLHAKHLDYHFKQFGV